MKKIWQTLFITFFLIGCAAKVSDIPKGYISKNEYLSSSREIKDNMIIDLNEVAKISGIEAQVKILNN